MRRNVKDANELCQPNLICEFDAFAAVLAEVVAVAAVVVVDVVGYVHGSVPFVERMLALPRTSPSHVDGPKSARADAVPTPRTYDPSAQTRVYLAGTQHSSDRNTPCTSSWCSVHITESE